MLIDKRLYFLVECVLLAVLGEEGVAPDLILAEVLSGGLPQTKEASHCAD